MSLLFSCFFLPRLFRTWGRSSTVGQSTGLTSPRSEGRAFKPNSLMLQAALKSRSWCVPHLGQVQLRSLNFNPLYTWPHLPQVFELGAKRPVLMRFTPYQLHLYSSSVRNIPKDASPTACAKWWFRCIPFTFKSSMQMVRTWLSCVSAWVILWRLSLRQLAMCSCSRATRMRALLRLDEPFRFRLKRFCNTFKRSRLPDKFFGLPNVRPSEHTASDMMPKSMTKDVSPCMG